VISKRTVLLVAPAGDRRDRLHRALVDAGFAVKVRTAESTPNEAFREDDPPELVLLDATGAGEVAWTLAENLEGIPWIVIVALPADITRSLTPARKTASWPKPTLTRSSRGLKPCCVVRPPDQRVTTRLPYT
jgi:DNA-binding NtrC family response regulator